MYKPVTSEQGRYKWGFYPFIQKHENLVNGHSISTVLSGYLLKGDGGSLTVDVLSTVDGSSYAFDAKGGSITVNLPSGEQTTTGSPSVVITGIASLTRSGGEWTYAGS